MNRQPDDISKYIRLVENINSPLDDSVFLESIDIPDTDVSQYIVEDVNDMIFKFRSYCEPAESQEYAQGVEEGLALAADMLERLLERYSKSSKE